MIVTRTNLSVPASAGTSAPPSASTGDAFAQQLSSAIADSLGRLGANAGEVNIAIRNAGNSATARQIVITYDPGATTAAAKTEVASVPSSPAARNPFLPQFDAATAPPLVSPKAQTSSSTEWSPWDGPRDPRDETVPGGGKVNANGSPEIKLSELPARNQYGYQGPAARNPYFTSPSNPMREGYVLGYQKWFQQGYVLGGKNGPVPTNKIYHATEDGAAEALRLVQQLEPGAKLVQKSWSGGPFSQSLPTWSVELPSGTLLNAGGVLASYYNHGYGVTTSSDTDLLREVRTVAS